MFITFEGINASGKSTQAKLLFERLQKQGKDVILTKEPGGLGNFPMKDFCTDIRRLICQTKNISKITEMFLLFASRKEHTDKLIVPALQAGKIVICDRYIDSTYAYQCCYDWNEMNFVSLLHKEIGGLLPDVTFFMDISVELSEYRLAPLISASIEHGDTAGYKKYDELETEHMQKIVNTYRFLAKKNSDRIKTIDGSLSVDEIATIIDKELSQKLS